MDTAARLSAIEARLAAVERRLGRMLPGTSSPFQCSGCRLGFAADEVPQALRDAIGATRFYHTECLPPAEREDHGR